MQAVVRICLDSWVDEKMIFAVLCLVLLVQVSEGLLFSCEGRTAGYYADISSNCQRYHVCTGGRLQYTYTCPNTTRFQQRMMICDHEYRVDCSKSEQDFSANLLLGQRDVPFVSTQELYSKRSLETQHTSPRTIKPQFFTNIRTFVTTVSPIQDFPISTKPVSENNNIIRRSRVKLEWTLPDTRAMLFIPDDPADAVEPNIKKYSITVPQPKMVFKAEKTFGGCPGNCDPRFLERGSCNPCVVVK